MQVKTFRTNSVKGFRQRRDENTVGGFELNAAIIFSSFELDLSGIIAFLGFKGVRVSVFFALFYPGFQRSFFVSMLYAALPVLKPHDHTMF